MAVVAGILTVRKGNRSKSVRVFAVPYYADEKLLTRAVTVGYYSAGIKLTKFGRLGRVNDHLSDAIG
jgi:hypothetical protein